MQTVANADDTTEEIMDIANVQVSNSYYYSAANHTGFKLVVTAKKSDPL